MDPQRLPLAFDANEPRIWIAVTGRSQAVEATLWQLHVEARARGREEVRVVLASQQQQNAQSDATLDGRLRELARHRARLEAVRADEGARVVFSAGSPLDALGPDPEAPLDEGETAVLGRCALALGWRPDCCALLLDSSEPTGTEAAELRWSGVTCVAVTDGEPATQIMRRVRDAIVEGKSERLHAVGDEPLKTEGWCAAIVRPPAGAVRAGRAENRPARLDVRLPRAAATPSGSQEQ